MQLAPNTRLVLTITPDGGVPVEYTAFVLGNHPSGVRTTLPQILHQSFAPLTGTPMLAAFDAGIKLAEFESEIVGYLATSPPSMVIAPPLEVTLRERRNSNRIRVSFPVTYTGKAGRFMFERTVSYDLSTGGLCMVTSQILPGNLPVTLTLELPKDKLEVHGLVKWSAFKERYKLTGVQFVDLPTNSEEAVARFLFSPDRLRMMPRPEST